MRGVAEDVYYVPREGGDAIGLNQLMQVPAHLSEVELRAIDEMSGRSWQSMGCTITGEAWPALRGGGSVVGLAHGMYYVGPDGSVYIISHPDRRPDLGGPAMDFARATVEAGRANLDKLRAEAKRLQ